MTRDPTLSPNNCECMTCGEIFKSEASFKKHRTALLKPYRPRCLTVQEMLDLGMVQNDKGLWVTAAFNKDAYAP